MGALQRMGTHEYKAPLVPPIAPSATSEIAITDWTTFWPLMVPSATFFRTPAWRVWDSRVTVRNMVHTQSTCLQREATVTITCDAIHLSYFRFSCYESFTRACNCVGKPIRFRECKAVFVLEDFGGRRLQTRVLEEGRSCSWTPFPSWSIGAFVQQGENCIRWNRGFVTGWKQQESKRESRHIQARLFRRVNDCDRLRQGTHHEGTRKDSLDIYIHRVQVFLHLTHNTSQFKFTQSS